MLMEPKTCVMYLVNQNTLDCSECGAVFQIDPNYMTDKMAFYQYCPHCGREIIDIRRDH